eukprot:gnl/MRDRNA2_/MRDRNA2_152667_c0_seq1.p1 gnl/MRDRNA2_/MRDRNA2_152667_c0~~gnl/MRDRNA2_/MRDRNA2_152667_c0_seq1.p1  ORF type:complete len:118 (+),score=10.10 gnl/MRDRNA2_/MRDRNA2_152667_c0_seq1:243-596(+)
MDQLCSGSGLYLPRLLYNTWFTQEELSMIKQLEQLLEPTGMGQVLARDSMALKLYQVDVRIILDDSASMNAGMKNELGCSNEGPHAVSLWQSSISARQRRGIHWLPTWSADTTLADG